MRRFFCGCGVRVFFDSVECIVCGAWLGFDPRAGTMVACPAGGDELLRPCRNRIEHGVCNWWRPAGQSGEYCDSCMLTEVIPNLSGWRNAVLWERMERWKRRLLYDLVRLGLLAPGAPGGIAAPTFRFLEDRRRNPLVEESFVLTGHYAGTITINLAEAEDSLRHAIREQMRERYRTLLGHFRHESGHYYFDPVIGVLDRGVERFRALFGDERTDYASAVRFHHERMHSNISVDFDRYVSRYAAAHPLEDWAETWAHFLHIGDTLETARANGMKGDADTVSPGWISHWSSLAVTLNELNRSLGMDDPYPFTLRPPVVEKLEFVRCAVAAATGRVPSP